MSAAQSTDQPLLQELLANGRFRVDRVVGIGAHGVVCRATHTILKRRVALKIVRSITEANTRRLLDEAAMLARIDHPGVLRIFDAGYLEDGSVYAACEWIDGQSFDAIKETARPSLDDGLRLVSALLDALAAAHDAGVLHRDVKPGNLLVPGAPDAPRYGEVKLMDFGIGEVMRTSSTGGRDVTRARRASGTACYVAPEQASGRRQTVASDLYSVGAILFEIIYGFPPLAPEHTATDFVIPFGKIDHFPVVVSRLTEEAVIPDQPAVPPRLREIVATLLRNEPTERFATAAIAKGEIDGALESLLAAARDSNA